MKVEQITRVFHGRPVLDALDLSIRAGEFVALLDEPFASLDALTRLKMQRLIGDLCQAHGPATLLVTHDVDEAILLADRVLVLRDGKIGFDRPVALPHPRQAGGGAFDGLRAELLAQLGVI